MTSSARMPDKAAYCLEQAQAAKAAGNSALQSDNLRGAVFQYKRVYLYLSEHLPDSVVTAASPAALSSSNSKGTPASGDAGSDGLVQLLTQQRRRAPGAGRGSQPPPPPPQSAASSSSAAASAQASSTSPHAAMVQLYATTLNNSALAHLKLGRYREGVNCASAVLEVPALRAALDDISGSAPLRACETPVGKALQRRASCYVALCDWAAAEADLQALAELSRATQAPSGSVSVLPGHDDAVVAQLRRAVEEGRQAEAAREKKMMQRMFA